MQFNIIIKMISYYPISTMIKIQLNILRMTLAS